MGIKNNNTQTYQKTHKTMLDIKLLDQTENNFSEQSNLFNLTKLKNGNFVLSNFVDYYRLKSVMTEWERRHKYITHAESTFAKLLEPIKLDDKLVTNDYFHNTPNDDFSFIDYDNFKLETSFNKVDSYDLQKTHNQARDYIDNNFGPKSYFATGNLVKEDSAVGRAEMKPKKNSLLQSKFKCSDGNFYSKEQYVTYYTTNRAQKKF